MPVDILYEIGVEEIPAGSVLPALDQLEAGLRQGLADLRLSHGPIHTYGTPRRLGVHVEAAQERQADHEAQLKGPPAAQAFDAEGNPTPAALGFARSRGVAVEDLQVLPTDRGDFVFVTVQEPGQALAALLPELLTRLTLGLTFPKTMRWGTQEVRFARPLRWLVLLVGQEPVEMELAGVRSGRVSRGHRTLGAREVPIAAPGEYLAALRAAGVVADHRERERLIVQGAHAQAAQAGGEALLDPPTVTEVNFLVEHPSCLRGSFDPAYLRLPREVIVKVMQGHQRYFPVQDAAGALLPHFLVVSNAGPQANAAVLAGNERVLRPRLEDAEFYFDEDLKRPLAARIEDLEHVTFLGGLGTLRDKTRRLVSLVGWLAERLPDVTPQQAQAAQRAAELCKCDLVTMMIGDTKLGELQGIVGGHYARHSGEAEPVAAAIAEHYRPAGPEDPLPQTAAGALVSLADKLDNLVAAFRLGMEPTGSADPQALRRQATGVVRLVRERGWRLPFEPTLGQALELLPEPPAEAEALSPDQTRERLRAFFAQRLEAVWQPEGVPYDVARAVLAVDWTDLVEVSERASYLAGLRREQPPTFAALTTVAERPARISRPQGLGPEPPVDPARFETEREAQVWAQAQQVQGQVEAALDGPRPDYGAAIEPLLTLAEPLHALFAEVMVMVEDERLRANRLGLMARLDALFLRLADFLQIVQEGGENSRGREGE